MVRTSPSALGSKLASGLPFASSRAIYRRVISGPFPPGWSVVKNPPIRILPSRCTTMLSTVPSAFGLKAASSAPFAFRRAIRFLGFPWTVVNEPPMRILPSGCGTAVSTEPPPMANFGESRSPGAALRIGKPRKMAVSRLKRASMRGKPGVFIRDDGTVSGDASSSRKRVSWEVTCSKDTFSLWRSHSVREGFSGGLFHPPTFGLSASRQDAPATFLKSRCHTA